MEPVTLTATTIATLAFTKFLEGSAGKAAEKFTGAALAKMDELRKQIWSKLSRFIVPPCLADQSAGSDPAPNKPL